MNLKHFWQGILDLVYPPRESCPLCGTHSPGAEICRQCRAWLREQGAGPACPICGRFPETPVNNGAAAAGVYAGSRPCFLCFSRRPSFNMARAVAPYRGVLREAVLHLKYRGARRVVRALGELMAGVARREQAFTRADVIIPVPLSPRRFASRGFNQAELLALELGRIMDLPVDARSVVKIRETRPQTGLSRREREQNLCDAFSVLFPEKIRDKNVLLVDDVLTTGSTVENISKRLRQCQTAGVFVLTAAGGVVSGNIDVDYRLRKRI